jgi:translation elongation factor EF-Tu-like GTPase
MFNVPDTNFSKRVAVSPQTTVRNQEVLLRVTKDRNILHTIQRRKAILTGHMLHRNRILKHIIGGNIEENMNMTGRQGIRRKQILDDLKETREHSKLKQEVLDRGVWRTSFGRSYGPVLRQTRE